MNPDLIQRLRTDPKPYATLIRQLGTRRSELNTEAQLHGVVDVERALSLEHLCQLARLIHVIVSDTQHPAPTLRDDLVRRFAGAPLRWSKDMDEPERLQRMIVARGFEDIAVYVASP